VGFWKEILQIGSEIINEKTTLAISFKRMCSIAEVRDNLGVQTTQFNKMSIQISSHVDKYSHVYLQDYFFDIYIFSFMMKLKSNKDR
jgi:hypothetical protein